MQDWTQRLRGWVGETVVTDFRSPFVAIGVLTDLGQDYLELTDADMHDLRDTETGRELYVVKAARFGVQANRRRLLVRHDDVLGVAKLSDVVTG
jgi:hypothetical protein